MISVHNQMATGIGDFNDKIIIVADIHSGANMVAEVNQFSYRTFK